MFPSHITTWCSVVSGEAKTFITGISLVIEPALNRCTSVYVQLSSSMWELESQTHTRSSLISGKERAEVPGRRKTDGHFFFCQLSICLSPYYHGLAQSEKTVHVFLRNISHNESYGSRLAQSSCGVNCLVSTWTPENPLCYGDWMMGLWWHYFHHSRNMMEEDKF